MKRNQNDIIKRLKTLYAGEGENGAFARMKVPWPRDLQEEFRAASARRSWDDVTTIKGIFPEWEKALTFLDEIEDDFIPALYPLPFDQGVYGAIFGAEIHFNRLSGPSGASSMTEPFEGEDYGKLMERIANPDERWLQMVEDDLRYFSEQCADRWGVAIPITIDGLNFAMQIRGNQTMMDIHDHPDDLKRLLQAAADFTIQFVERERAAINMELAGGVYDYFNAGWIPKQSIPMSVDCYNLCAPSVYAEFGRPYQQQLIDHFGGGNFHIHGNGRHMLDEFSQLRGCVAVLIADDGSDVAAMDDLTAIKERLGSITPAVGCPKDRFAKELKERSLPGGVYYEVTGLDDVDEANRIMDIVRNYSL